MNARAEHDFPKLSNVMSDMIVYGSGFYKVGADMIQHIPFHEIIGGDLTN
jgi:hypothetical protein